MENNKILIQDLAEAIANREGITKKKAETFVKALFEMIEEGLAHDKFVKIKGLGTFKLIEVGERESVNINTGERFSIESHSKISFTPDALLRDLVNAPFAHFQTTILNEETELDELDRVDAELLQDAEGDEEDTTGEEHKPDAAADSPAQTVLQPETDIADENEIITTEETGESFEKEIIIKKEPKEDTASEETGNAPEESAEEAGEEETSTPGEDVEASQHRENVGISAEEDGSSALQETDDKMQEAEEPEDDAEPALPTTTSNNDFCDETDTPTDREPEKGGEKAEEAEPETPTEAPDVIPRVAPDAPKEEMAEDSRSCGETAAPGERECLQYIIRDERPPRPNIWKVVALALLAALILILTYFAGYFKLFCPCEIWDCNDPVGPSTGVTVPISRQPAVPAVQTDSTQTDSMELLPATAPSDSTRQQVAASTDAVRNDTTPKPAATTKKTENRQNAAREPASRPAAYPQVNGGKYQITGTLRTYRVAGGETLRAIAQKIYGSKGYAVYIATYNRIEDPNRIDSGTLLQLPRLEKRP